jgi:hypothetical protein
MVEKQLNNKRSDHNYGHFFLHIANSKTMKRKRYIADSERVMVKVYENVRCQSGDRHKRYRSAHGRTWR